MTLVWVVGITNAFNLLDNMDGLSAGVALVASLVLLLNAWLLGGFFMSLVYVALIGSLLGFLVYNWHPASIFLGDSGSLFIGFVLASLTLLQRYVSHASSTYFPVLMPVLVLALPILDTATVTFIRIRERRPIYVGDSRHLSHRLVSLGMRPPLAVFTIYLISLGLGPRRGGPRPREPRPTRSSSCVQALAVVAVVLILLFYERRARAAAGGAVTVAPRCSSPPSPRCRSPEVQAVRFTTIDHRAALRVLVSDDMPPGEIVREGGGADPPPRRGPGELPPARGRAAPRGALGRARGGRHRAAGERGPGGAVRGELRAGDGDRRLRRASPTRPGAGR